MFPHKSRCFALKNEMLKSFKSIDFIQRKKLKTQSLFLSFPFKSILSIISPLVFYKMALKLILLLGFLHICYGSPLSVLGKSFSNIATRQERDCTPLNIGFYKVCFHFIPPMTLDTYHTAVSHGLYEEGSRS